MKNKIPITKYNVPRAKWYFVLFKFLELFGVFLFTFGFYGLGCVVLKHCPWFYNLSYMSNSVCTSYLCIWFTGFLAFFGIFASLCIGGVILYWMYNIIKAWIRGNWNLAKKAAEDKTAKAKRLKQQELEKKRVELEEKRADRAKWGYCVGDEAKYICRDKDAANKARLGQKCKILKIDKVGDISPEWEDGTTGGVIKKYVKSSSFKITKKQKLT